MKSESVRCELNRAEEDSVMGCCPAVFGIAQLFFFLRKRMLLSFLRMQLCLTQSNAFQASFSASFSFIMCNAIMLIKISCMNRTMGLQHLVLAALVTAGCGMPRSHAQPEPKKELPCWPCEDFAVFYGAKHQGTLEVYCRIHEKIAVKGVVYNHGHGLELVHPLAPMEIHEQQDSPDTYELIFCPQDREGALNAVRGPVRIGYVSPGSWTSHVLMRAVDEQGNISTILFPRTSGYADKKSLEIYEHTARDTPPQQ